MKTAQSLGFAALIVLGLGCGTDAFYAETQPLDPDLGWEADEEASCGVACELPSMTRSQVVSLSYARERKKIQS